MPKPTKADLICGLLSYWDPLAFEGKAGPMFYNYEVEVLAQSVRAVTVSTSVVQSS